MSIKILELGENWRKYARMVPQGFTPLGVVLRDKRVHAFARDEQGLYWIFGDGKPVELPQAKIQRAIASITTREAPKPDDLAPESESSP